MSLLTGRHPYAQDCWTNDDFLASDRPTLAHALGAAGYEPVLIGRLHALGPDELRGYVRRRWVSTARTRSASLDTTWASSPAPTTRRRRASSAPAAARAPTS